MQVYTLLNESIQNNYYDYHTFLNSIVGTVSLFKHTVKGCCASLYILIVLISWYNDDLQSNDYYLIQLSITEDRLEQCHGILL